MSEIQSILFDWTGVMAPDKREPQNILISRMTESGLKADLAQKIVNIAIHNFMTGAPENEFWQSITKQSKIEKDENIWESWTGHVAWPETIPLVKRVSQIGIRTVAFSNVLPPCKLMIQEVGGYDEFDELFLSCDQNKAKPDTSFFQKYLYRSEQEAGSCLLIDDMIENIESARKTGISTFHAKDRITTKNFIENIIQSAL